MNLLNINKWLVSRTKTLLKRRKIAIKSRPISAKKLKQQSKLFNYAKQYKALQIQKQLDRRNYSTQHINQLMDEIFYPDVTHANQEAAKLHLEASMLKDYTEYANQGSDRQVSELQMLIEEKILGSQLIQLYNENNNQITIDECLILFKRLSQYFNKKQDIKQRVERKWAKMNQQLKKKNKQYKQKKCPYIFVDKDDLIHYKPWNDMLNSLQQKIKISMENQQNKINTMLIFAQIIESMRKGINYIPAQIYLLFSNSIAKLGQKQIEQLQLSQADLLLRVINLRPFIRYPIHTVIKSQQGLQSKQTQINQKFYNNIIKLVLQIINNNQATSLQIQNVITYLNININNKDNKDGNKLKIIQQINKQLLNAVFRNLAELPFEKVIQLFQIYTIPITQINNTTFLDNNFINIENAQILKFDILRKSTNAIDKQYMFRFLQIIYKRQITLRNKSDNNINNNNKLYAFDVFNQIVSTILSKYGGRNLLTYQQVLKLIDSSFINSLVDHNLLQFISSQIVKMRDQFTLNQLTESIFKIFILGYQSPVLARILFEQQKKKYQTTKKKLMQNNILLLSGKTEDKTQNNIKSKYKQQNCIPIQQLQLQQNLIISLWLLFLTKPNNQKLPISTDELMKIYPLTISSRHPLINQLVLNLNEQTKKLGILWKIKYMAIDIKNSNKNRLNLFYQVHPNDVKDLYLSTMKLEAASSDDFYIHYNFKTNKFIPYSWSKSNTYSLETYRKWIVDNQKNDTNYFNPTKAINSVIKEGRQKIMNKIQLQQKKLKNNKEIYSIKDQKEFQIYKID